MTDNVIFIVDGEPVPKQSFRYAKGGGYTDPRVTAWQKSVAKAAREAMHFGLPFTGPIAMRVVFVLSNSRRVDLDNLNKGVCDAMNGIVFVDDAQIVSLHLVKHIKTKPGILVEVYPGGLLPFLVERKP